MATRFPSPAEEELADSISLQDLLRDNKATTFLLKVSVDSMMDEGIKPRDMIIVDKGRMPKSEGMAIVEVATSGL